MPCIEIPTGTCIIGLTRYGGVVLEFPMADPDKARALFDSLKQAADSGKFTISLDTTPAYLIDEDFVPPKSSGHATLWLSIMVLIAFAVAAVIGYKRGW